MKSQLPSTISTGKNYKLHGTVVYAAVSRVSNSLYCGSAGYIARKIKDSTAQIDEKRMSISEIAKAVERGVMPSFIIARYNSSLSPEYNFIKERAARGKRRVIRSLRSIGNWIE